MANTLKFGNGEWYGKKDTILAYNDENDNYKPLLFDFSRGSSATVINKDGLIETVGSGEPRIDYKDDTKGALLLEPQRSNLVTYSQDFSNSIWNTGTTRSVNFVSTSTIDPEGKTNAYRVTSTASDNQVAVLSSIVSGQDYTNSIYVRRVSGSGNVNLRNVNNGANEFELSVSDGWKRIETNATSTSTNGRLYINLQAVGDVIEIWGAQVEQGSYATSYIPTSGSAVTRIADACYNDNLANVIGQTEGTFYLETVPLNSLTSYTERVIQFESSGSGFMTIQRYANDNITFYGTNGSNNWSIQGTGLFVGGQTIKIAGAYKDNDITLYVNGVQIGTNTTANAPQTEKLRFANNTSGSLGYLGSHKDVKLYNTRLSNSELEALTTIQE
jgi:hypothetical protein